MQNNTQGKSTNSYFDMPLTLSSLLANSNIVIGPQLKEDTPSQFFLRPLKLHNITTFSNIDNPKLIFNSSSYYLDVYKLLQKEIHSDKLSKEYNFNLNDSYSKLNSQNIFYLHFPQQKFLIPNLNFKLSQIKNLSFSNTNLNKNLVNSTNFKLNFIQGLITISTHGRIICLEENKENILYQNIFGIWLDYRQISISPKKKDLDDFIEKENINIYINCLKFVENTFYMRKMMPIIDENLSSFLCVIFFKNTQCQYLVELDNAEQNYFVMLDLLQNSSLVASEFFNINDTYLKTSLANKSKNQFDESNQKRKIENTNKNEMSNSKLCSIIVGDYEDALEENNFIFALPVKKYSLNEGSTQSSNNYNETFIKWNNMVKNNEKDIKDLTQKVSQLEYQIKDIYDLLSKEEDMNDDEDNNTPQNKKDEDFQPDKIIHTKIQNDKPKSKVNKYKMNHKSKLIEFNTDDSQDVLKSLVIPKIKDVKFTYDTIDDDDL